MSGQDTDPVEAGHVGDDDLYEISEWERRTGLDTLAAYVYTALAVGGRGLLVGLAALLLAAQLGTILLAIYVNPALGLLTVLSVLPAFLLVGGIWYVDDTMREPLVPLAVTFVLSIFFASFAALVNTALKPVFGVVPYVGMILYFFLVVGPIEETVKWLAIRVYAYNDVAFDAVVDGAVYGAVAGLGFATIENALYITQAVLQSGGLDSIQPLENAVGVAVTRGFVGPGHVIYSAFAGYYLGLAKYNPEDWGVIVTKGLLVAVGIHATYNTAVTYIQFGAMPGFSVFGGLVGVSAFVAFVLVYDGIFGYVLYRKLANYRDAYREATDEESDADAEAA